MILGLPADATAGAENSALLQEFLGRKPRGESSRETSQSGMLVVPVGPGEKTRKQHEMYASGWQLPSHFLHEHSE
jgi:hypothetical protein